MNRELWPQVEALFEKALALPASERTSYIESQRQRIPDTVCDEVHSLVKNYQATTEQDSSSFFDEELESLVRHFANELSKEVGDSETFPSENAKQKTKRIASESRIIEQLSKQAPDFEILRTIGHGGMGIVFKARQKSLDRIVALKVLHTSLIDDSLRARFIRESQAIARIQNDHVVAVHAVHDEAIPFLVMEFVDGLTLKELVEKEETIEPRTAAALTHQVATGLAAAHERKLIHRDVKPANILLESIDKPNSIGLENRRAKLVDFGVARDLESDGYTLDKMVVGTPSYMSPEQLFDPESVDHRSDVYGLGMTLYEMLTGQVAYRGSPHSIMRQVESNALISPRKQNSNVSQDLESICLKALNKSKEHRYQTATALADDLKRFLDGVPTIARPVSRLEDLRRKIIRNPRISAAIAATAAMFLTVVIVAASFSLAMKLKDKEIVKANQATIESRLETLLKARPTDLQTEIADNLPFSTELISRLREESLSNERSTMHKFNAAVALSHVTNEHSEFVVACLPELAENTVVFDNVLLALKNDPRRREILLDAMNRTGNKHEKAKLVILLAFGGDLSPWIQHSSVPQKDPDLRTEFIHAFSSWHGKLTPFVEVLKSHSDQKWIWTACQALALLDHRQLDVNARDAATDFLKDCCEKNQHAVVVSSAKHALDRWEVVYEQPQPLADSNWFRTKNGIRMVRIEPGTVQLGRIDPRKVKHDWPPHEVTISNSYYVADAEVSLGQFSEFAEIYQTRQPNFNWGYTPDSGPPPTHPAPNVSWYGAARFCNWLSEIHGLEEVYEKMDDDLTCEMDDGQKFQIQDFIIHRDRNGFRLPNEVEWEHACRHGTETVFYHGNRADLFPMYGVSSNLINISTTPIRTHLPNSNGLFDMIGNVWEWTNDWYTKDVALSGTVDPIGPESFSTALAGRIIRGGGVANQSGNADSEARGANVPSVRYSNIGFRVAIPERPASLADHTDIAD